MTSSNSKSRCEMARAPPLLEAVAVAATEAAACARRGPSHGASSVPSREEDAVADGQNRSYPSRDLHMRMDGNGWL